jgi:hypothetical protein
MFDNLVRWHSLLVRASMLTSPWASNWVQLSAKVLLRLVPFISILGLSCEDLVRIDAPGEQLSQGQTFSHFFPIR